MTTTQTRDAEILGHKAKVITTTEQKGSGTQVTSFQVIVNGRDIIADLWPQANRNGKAKK